MVERSLALPLHSRAPSLGELAVGRDNNLNLLRLVAASLVLFSHAFALSTGDAMMEPLRRQLGVTFGSIAVDIFFVASGFLVTGSLLARASVPSFLRARALRVYPGLIVANLLTVFLLGAAATTLPLPDYLTHPGTLRFLVKNSLLVANVEFNLPGVFAANPWKDGVNGSLWTLPYEIGMYAALACLWTAWRRKPLLEFPRLLAAVALAGLALHVLSHYFWLDSGLFRLAAMFFAGAACHGLRHRIILSWRLFFPLAALLLGACLDARAFFLVYTLVLPYLVLCLAYLPGGPIRAWNKAGDYSYGIYIYAFPVQQGLACFLPGIGPGPLLFLSFLATACLAAFSWHCIERRALGLKNE